jgi:hypothetical protein
MMAFVLVGAIIGTLAGQLLASQVPVLGHHTSLRWHPSADLAFIRYTLDLTFQVNWMTLVGVIVLFFVERKFR